MKKIDQFTGDFEYLSNFSSHSFVDENETEWKTLEHFYQAAKTLHPLWRMLIWEAPEPNIAKKLGRTCPLRQDWDKLRIFIMSKGLKFKFDQNTEIKVKLMSTDGFVLIEGNNWHDNLWGDCLCKKCENITGQNRLGELLMKLRDSYLGKYNNELEYLPTSQRRYYEQIM